MKTTKVCKNCNKIFVSRRSNHVYCTTSCKTKASYKRNDYKYVSGHYKKNENLSESRGEIVSSKSDIIKSMKVLENKIESIQKLANINQASVTNAALGSATADATVFGLKKIFAPNTLPATKADILVFKNELNELKKMILYITHKNHNF